MIWRVTIINYLFPCRKSTCNPSLKVHPKNLEVWDREIIEFQEFLVLKKNGRIKDTRDTRVSYKCRIKTGRIKNQ